MSDETRLCPACQTENDALNRECVKCGQPLIVVCLRCYTVNPIAAEKCSACGLRFDTLGQIMARHEVRMADRFTRQASTANEAKDTQIEQAQARSQQLWQPERDRQAYLLAQKQRQKQQERYLLIAAIAVSVVLVLWLLISFAR